MPPDSDTESEPESSFAQNASDFLLSRSNIPQSAEQSATAAKLAVEELKRIDVSVVAQDTSLHNIIQAASSDILDFLDDVIAAPLLSNEAVISTLAAFASITRDSFLVLLFNYRKVFHDIAARALIPGTTASTTISWVDVILAKLSDAVVAIASGFLTVSSEPPTSTILKQQRDEDTLRAAAQLPQKWQTVPDVIASDHASPAAKRLALRLVFASCVMGPQIVPYDPWATDGVCPSEMINILQSCLQQISRSGSLDVDIRLQEKVSFSMIISIFAVADMVERERNEGRVLPFIPGSHASLLRLIQIIMNPENPPSSLALNAPCGSLDAAQTILTRWGETIPWSWTVWDDPRITNIESVTHLTATWLHHLDTHLSEEATDDSVEILSAGLIPRLLKYQTAAKFAILQLLHNSLNTLSSSLRTERSPGPVLDVISKACWAIVQLVDPMVSDGWKDQNSSHELCKCLCGIFVSLGDTHDEQMIREYIVEAITHMDTKTVRQALKSAKEDTRIGFVTKLDEKLARCKRTLFDQTGHLTILQSSLHASKLMLNFLAIMWHCGTRGSLHPQTTSTFFASLAAQMLVEHPSSLPSKLLRDTLLTSLAILELQRGDLSFGDVKFTWKDDTVWQLALSCGSSNLVVASAFAQYVLTSNRMCDSLYCAETCDYFRDTLLLVLSRHFFGHNEPLALLVCPATCRALSCLIKQADPVTAHFVLSSPRTMNICTDLRALLKDDSSHSEYRTILKERLLGVGQALLDQITRRLRPGVDPDQGVEMGSPQAQSKLLFTRLDSTFHLIQLPIS